MIHVPLPYAIAFHALGLLELSSRRPSTTGPSDSVVSPSGPFASNSRRYSIRISSMNFAPCGSRETSAPNSWPAPPSATHADMIWRKPHCPTTDARPRAPAAIRRRKPAPMRASRKRPHRRRQIRQRRQINHACEPLSEAPRERRNLDPVDRRVAKSRPIEIHSGSHFSGNLSQLRRKDLLSPAACRAARQCIVGRPARTGAAPSERERRRRDPAQPRRCRGRSAPRPHGWPKPRSDSAPLQNLLSYTPRLNPISRSGPSERAA